MKFNIIVINTAASSGGALTILKQFIDSAKKYSSIDINYHIFVSQNDLEKYAEKNINIISIDNGNSYIKRAFYQKKFIKNWCDINKVKPNLVISLQNIGVSGFSEIPQIIYLHQPIPFRPDLKWSILKKDEIRYWLYKNVYLELIKYWAKRTSCFIVQTEWMKKALVDQLNMDIEKIELIKPDIEKIDVEKINHLKLDNKCINMFYPTSSVKYKNYTLLFDVMKKLNKNNLTHKLYITLDFNFVKKILGQNPNQIGIECLGSISYRNVLEYYKSVDLLLFPSYLETFGLPLVEARDFGLPIIAADLDYAKEVLKGYEGATFSLYNNIDEWVNKIKNTKIMKYTYKNNDFEIKGWKELFNVIEKVTRE